MTIMDASRRNGATRRAAPSASGGIGGTYSRLALQSRSHAKHTSDFARPARSRRRLRPRRTEDPPLRRTFLLAGHLHQLARPLVRSGDAVLVSKRRRDRRPLRHAVEAK